MIELRFSVATVRGAVKPFVRFRVRDGKTGKLIGHLYKQRHRANKRVDTLNARWTKAETWRKTAEYIAAKEGH